MLTDLIRRTITRLTTPLKTVTYSCGKCDMTMKITDHPDRVNRLLDIALAHNCKPPTKTL